MKKIKFLATALLALGYPSPSGAQDIATDSKGKGVFSMYGMKSVRFDFSQKDFTATVRLYYDTINYYRISKGTINRTQVLKTHNYYLQGSLLNAVDMVSLTDLSNFRPGGRIRLGYQINPDTISTDYRGSTYGAGINTFVAVDNFRHYDPAVSNQISVQNPWSFGIEGNLTWFLPEFFSERWAALAFNGTLSRGWNDNTLLNFKERNQAVVDTNVVAFDKFSGKYGELKTDVNRVRIAVSMPIRLAWLDETSFDWLLYYSPTPYAVVNITNAGAPVYIAGVYNNLFASKLNFNKFTVPSSFGIGVDWIQTEGSWSVPNWFVRGNISFK